MINISTKGKDKPRKGQCRTPIGTLKRAWDWRHQLPTGGWGYTRMLKTGGLCEDLYKE